MTVITALNAGQIAAEVERISFELDQARKDVAKLKRLRNAEADEKRLTAELQATQEQLADRMASDLLAKREDLYAKFEDIRITETQLQMGEGLMHTRFDISVFERQSINSQTFIREAPYRSFNELPGDAFSYLLDKHPERIPARIMALHPGDAWEAFREYLVSMRRGYFTHPAAAA